MEPYDARVPRSALPVRYVRTSSLGRLATPAFEQFWFRVRRRRHAFFRRAGQGPADVPRWSYLASDPTQILSSDDGPAGRTADPFESLASHWPHRVARDGPRTPFSGGFAGFIGYEARSAVEASPPGRRPPDGFPTYWLGRYDAVLAYDHRTHRAFVSGVGPTADEAERARADLCRRLVPIGEENRPASPHVPAPRPVVTASAYRRRVAAVRRRIRRGDLFQANVSQRFEGAWGAGAPDLFDRLSDASSTPFSTFVDIGHERAILSMSPERFLARTGDRLETRPMKGTRRRGRTRRQDLTLIRDLRSSEKDRAELAMIVDLARNDLSRSCAPGSVRVEMARRLERYATVHQAVGVVSGRLSRDVHPTEAIRRAFPPGSVTGAPKVEAMNVIDALEGEARGPYCGAIGWFDEGGDFDLAVAIRTVCLCASKVSYRVGGGVTWLSDPEDERIETLDKGAAIARAISGGHGR